MTPEVMGGAERRRVAPVAGLSAAEPSPSLWRETGRRFLRHRLATVGAAVLVVMVVGVVAGPLVWRVPVNEIDFKAKLRTPSWSHPLGTDDLGQDLLARMLYGGRISLVIGVAAVVISTTIGVLLGLAGGYFGGRVDWTIMTAVNVLLTFPFVLLALAVIAVLGASLTNMIVVLGVAGWPIYARVVRAETLAIREREFVVAGRALGMSHARLIFRQILPNLDRKSVV